MIKGSFKVNTIEEGTCVETKVKNMTYKGEEEELLEEILNLSLYFATNMPRNFFMELGYNEMEIENKIFSAKIYLLMALFDIDLEETDLKDFIEKVKNK